MGLKGEVSKISDTILIKLLLVSHYVPQKFCLFNIKLEANKMF